MAERQAERDAIQQQRQITRRDLALAHKRVAIATRVHGEALLLGRLLREAFHHLDAGDRLGQPGVHGAEARPQQAGHRPQVIVVDA